MAKTSEYFSQKKFLDDIILNGLQYSIIVAILLPFIHFHTHEPAVFKLKFLARCYIFLLESVTKMRLRFCTYPVLFNS
jgi:hypothetical protein